MISWKIPNLRYFLAKQLSQIAIQVLFFSSNLEKEFYLRFSLLMVLPLTLSSLLSFSCFKLLSTIVNNFYSLLWQTCNFLNIGPKLEWLLTSGTPDTKNFHTEAFPKFKRDQKFLSVANFPIIPSFLLFPMIRPYQLC